MQIKTLYKHSWLLTFAQFVQLDKEVWKNAPQRDNGIVYIIQLKNINGHDFHKWLIFVNGF